jgi:SP family general alpha glucoside:H+ symporter-like MFS transporter
MIPFIPESHLHHARKGNDEKAKASMIRLYGTAPDYDVVSQTTAVYSVKS